MSSSVSESNLIKKFHSVTNTQDSIQTLSLWIIHHKSHNKKIVEIWMKALKKAKISHRLTLFYLANDVIQNSKRKGAPQYNQAFLNVLKDAALLLRDEKIKQSVERVFLIWENRSVFTSDVIEELRGILNSVANNGKTPTATVNKLLADFKPECTIEKIRTACKLEKETIQKFLTLNNSKLDVANSEVLRQFKDRKHGQRFSKDFEDATRYLEEYIEALEKEISERSELLLVLEQTEIYYDSQCGEARVVANAYKNFSNRVSAQKKRIEVILSQIPSPFPSPCADAPSPTKSEEADFTHVSLKATSPSSVKEDSIPSPEGTPEDLRLSPNIEDAEASSFMKQGGPGMLTTWLEAFQSESSPAPAKKIKVPTTSSSLDSRLMNMMQKIPGQMLQQSFLDQKGIVALSGDNTPVKDEHSGQGTPVLDEGKVLSDQIQQDSKTAENNSVSKNANFSGRNSSNKIDMSFEKEHEERDRIAPLLPPPKPDFSSFGIFESPPASSNSSNGNNIVIKTRPDPRLNSHTYKTNKHSNDKTSLTQGNDDTEIMDMELEESDDEEKKSKDTSVYEGGKRMKPESKITSLANPILTTYEQKIPTMVQHFKNNHHQIKDFSSSSYERIPNRLGSELEGHPPRRGNYRQLDEDARFGNDMMSDQFSDMPNRMNNELYPSSNRMGNDHQIQSHCMEPNRMSDHRDDPLRMDLPILPTPPQMMEPDEFRHGPRDSHWPNEPWVGGQPHLGPSGGSQEYQQEPFPYDDRPAIRMQPPPEFPPELEARFNGTLYPPYFEEDQGFHHPHVPQHHLPKQFPNRPPNRPPYRGRGRGSFYNRY